MTFYNPFGNPPKLPTEKAKNNPLVIVSHEPVVVKKITTSERIKQILEEHGNLESNIPVNHDEYWQLKQGSSR